ncbi:hypothetical protein [Microbacterium sp. LWO13-1.2]
MRQLEDIEAWIDRRVPFLGDVGDGRALHLHTSRADRRMDV